MRCFVIFSLVILLPVGVWAQDRMKDVPDGHWASEAVYELVKMGVTTGYPDGTFRGKNAISRYEMASLLSKLAKSSCREQGLDEKLIAELRAEAALLKFKMDHQAEETKLSGEIESRYRLSTLSPRGGKTDYRLRLDLLKRIDDQTSLKIGLDTVDAGYNADSDRPLATKLLDVESRFKLAGMDFKVNLGPGVVPHSDDFFPSENNTVYIRPKTAVEATKAIGKMTFSSAYVTRQVETSGKIGVHELTGKIKYKFGNLALHFRPRCLFVVDGPRDVLAEAGLNYMLDDHWITYFLLGVGDFEAGRSGMYLKVEEKMIDPWKTGTTVVLRFDKVGSKYRRDDLDEYEFIYLNNFNRLILDGTTDLGLRIRQELWDNTALEWRGDYVTDGAFNYGEAYPETYFLWQLGFLYKLSGTTDFRAFYRLYNVPSGIAQFSDAVPKMSELFGFALKCEF